MIENFDQFDISEDIKKAIEDMGFEQPSPIQERSIPLVLSGVDMIGQAQTGTGKTAAFGIPIVEKVDENDKSVQAMILCPTRELSIQVAEELSKLAKYKKNVRVVPIYGGQPIERQIKALKSGTQIVVGTPGRVIDHIKRRTLKTGNVKIFVLDEADEMFDMGFREDIEEVLGHIPEDRQTTFFSATMAAEIMKFASKFQNNPEIVKVVKKAMTVPKVDQYYFDLESHMKTEILTRVIDINNPYLTIVFCNTKKMVDELTSQLNDRGYLAEGLHGDLKQSQRDAVMNKFRKNNVDILVATDVAARGIDVDEVDMVINYDMPQDDEYYVHRIGRTARAGRSGTAISFVSGRDFYKLRDIQRYTKTTITRKEIPTLKDLKENESNKLISIINETIGKKETQKYENILNILLEEGHSPIDIATTLIYLQDKQKGSQGHEELDFIDNDKEKPRKKRARDSREERGKKQAKSQARLFLSVGKKDKINNRHIVGKIMESDLIDKSKVGQIELFDNFSFVEILDDSVEEVRAFLDEARIKGKKVNCEIAKPKPKSKSKSKGRKRR